VLVQDNLNIHCKASLYEASPTVEARRLVERFEWHYTPKHGIVAQSQFPRETSSVDLDFDAVQTVWRCTFARTSTIVGPTGCSSKRRHGSLVPKRHGAMCHGVPREKRAYHRFIWRI
jgi:hypothetical protein